MARPAYKDASCPVAHRVEDLLSRMTVDEKLAQLVGVPTGDFMTRGKFSAAKAKKLLANGVGQITRVGGAPQGLSIRQCAQFIADLQKHILKNTRLGIPAMVHEECLSGFTARGATTFPQAIGLASTWDPALMRRITTTIRKQVRAIGASQGLSPVLDVLRDPRWGRTEETLGEDPYLVARMGVAYIKGLQGDDPCEGLAATPKHFAAHGFPEGGRNTAPVHVGEREFREVFLFPFEAAVKVAKARSVMNAYHVCDGVPAACDRKLLTGILREEWGFEGFVFSDYGSITMLQTQHGVAASRQEAGVKALEAGIDIELPSADCYGAPLRAALLAGSVSQETINTAVRRILRAKFELGLFERPHVDPRKAPRSLDPPAARGLAKVAAQKSITLLSNKGALPLAKTVTSVAVVGPNADSVHALYGDYAYTNHVPAPNDLVSVTALAGIKRKVRRAKVLYAKGCECSGSDTSGFDDAITAAKACDLVIAVMGERSGFYNDNISGENCDRADLRLPGVQEQLVLALAETRKPVILVLMNGHPLALGTVAHRCAAVIEAWLPGEEGGNALADILFGDVNPSGKLPVSFPAEVGQVPLHYYRKPSSFWHYVDTDAFPVGKIAATPAYPFGHGLSYTAFRYSALSITPKKCGPTGSVTVKCRVTNTGNVAGDEVVQLYIRDEVASVSRPVMELKGFVRVALKPRETRSVAFTLALDQLAFYDPHMRFVVEPGTFRVMVGSSSADIRLKGAFEVTGPTKVVMSQRTFFSKVETR